MQVKFDDSRQKVPIKLWTDGVPVEYQAMAQLINTSSMPFIFKHLAVMPDVHLGRGSTVGSVIPTQGAVIPAAVGVDIGCGMMAMKTDLTANDLPTNLKGVRDKIEEYIPVGFSAHKTVQGARANIWQAMTMHPGYATVQAARIKDATAPSQLGTLGSGNHFIEICLDEFQTVWIVLHSGSRGIGNKIGQHFIEVAKRDMRIHFINLPDQDLAYLSEGTQHFDDYMSAVEWAQDYATYNRKIMLDLVILALRDALGRSVTHNLYEPIVSCHHNYVSRENHFGHNVLVTRKGAVRARVGDLGVIPGSMGAKSFIVRGRGNSESFESCSHGAGRKMSRTAAKERVSVDDFREAVAGVECRTDTGVLDEAPQAYKDIDAVMAAQQDLVEILYTLRQVVCVKG